MADTKISALTAATTLADTDQLVIASAGASKSITGANLKASIPGTGGGGPWALLSTTTLGSAATFDVSSISGSYNDLNLILIGRGADAGAFETVRLTLNNDTGNNYYLERTGLTGTTQTPTESLAAANLTLATSWPATGAAANLYGMSEITISGYASTTWKKVVQWRSFGAVGTSTGNLIMAFGAGLWNSTAAVTRVTIVNATTANFATGSQLRIYGRL